MRERVEDFINILVEVDCCRVLLFYIEELENFFGLRLNNINNS